MRRLLGLFVVVVLVSWVLWYFLLPDDSDECEDLERRDWSQLTADEQDWLDARCSEPEGG